MTLTEGLVLVSGLAIGYWFVSVFLPHATRERREADREAAREREQAPPVGGLPPVPSATTPAGAPPSPPWHEVLGVAHDAARSDIRLAYEAGLARYHPDRFDGLDPELQALARRKTRDLHSAYQAALERGG